MSRVAAGRRACRYTVLVHDRTRVESAGGLARSSHDADDDGTSWSKSCPAQAQRLRRGPATLHQDDSRVAAAMVAHEIATDEYGLSVLAAGPWATGRPASLNPSCYSLAAFQQLAEFIGDRIWHRGPSRRLRGRAPGQILVATDATGVTVRAPAEHAFGRQAPPWLRHNRATCRRQAQQPLTMFRVALW